MAVKKPSAKTKSKEIRDRLNALDPARKSRLLDPAEAEFAQFGFAEASLNRILKAASMSKGQAYYYILDKPDLYRAVIERAIGRLIEALNSEVSEPGGIQAFWEIVRDRLGALTLHFVHNEHDAALARTIYESAAAREACSDALHRVAQLISGLTVRGQALGAVRTDLPQSLLVGLIMSIAGELDRWFAENWEGMNQDRALEMANLSVDLIRSVAEPRSR